MRSLLRVFVRLAIFAGMWAAVQAGVKTLTAKHLGGEQQREQQRHVAVQQENEGPLSGIKKMVTGNNTSNQVARSRPVTGAGIVWGEPSSSDESYYKDYPASQ